VERPHLELIGRIADPPLQKVAYRLHMSGEYAELRHKIGKS